MNAQDIFDGLRTLLHDAPTQKGFDAILALLRKGKALDPDLCEAVWHPYAVEHLAGWRAQTPLQPSEPRFGNHEPAHLLSDPLGIDKEGRAIADIFDPDMFGLDLARTLRIFGQPYAKTHPLTQIERFADNPALTNLQGLEIAHIPLTDTECATLANSPHLSGLTALAMDKGQFGRQGLEALAKARSLSKLTALILQRIPLGNSLEVLARSRVFRKLHHLALPFNQLCAEDIAALARGRVMSGLQTLELSHNPDIGPKGASALAKFANPQALHTLRMAFTGLRHDGFRALVQSPWFNGINHFRADNNRLRPDSLAALTQRTGTHLHHLSLNHNDIGRVGAESLASWPDARHLRTLLLSRTNLGDEGLESLAHCPRLAHIEALDVSGNGLGPVSVAQLAQSPMMQNCRALRLDHNPIGDEGIALLCSAPWLSKLDHISIEHTGFGTEGAAHLAQAKALGNLAI